MLAFGPGVGVLYVRVLDSAPTTPVPSTLKLKDEDSSDWFELTLEANPGTTGYYLDWEDTPVSAGTDPEWILEASGGTRYRWGFKRDGATLVLDVLGTTSDPPMTVQMEASDATTRTIVVRDDAGVYLDFL